MRHATKQGRYSPCVCLMCAHAHTDQLTKTCPERSPDVEYARKILLNQLS